MSEQIIVTIDETLRQNVLQVLEKEGVTEEEAIRMYYFTIAQNQAVPRGKVKRDEAYLKSLPVSKNIPNKETIAALEESRDYTKLKQYSSLQEIYKELDAADTDR